MAEFKVRVKTDKNGDTTNIIINNYYNIDNDYVYLYCNVHLISLPESIVNLTNLQELKLYDNKLTSLPDTIGNLTNLQVLYCYYNKLTSLPESIVNLTNLKLLNCSYNKLTLLPETIGNLTNLQELYCCYNKLTSLPETIGNLTNLQNLWCGRNKLTSLPDIIVNLINLQLLNCSNNNLVSLPKIIGYLTKLQQLDCGDNSLTSLPETIGNLINLQSLWCNSNNLGSLPISIIRCRRLNYIYYSNNPIDNIPIQLLRFFNRIENRNENIFTIYNDKQNIHNSSIQLSIFESIQRLTNHVKTELDLDLLISEIVNDTILTCQERLLQYMENTEYHSLLMLNFAEILWLVWSVIKEFEPEIQTEIKRRLNEEVAEAECMCFTGSCNRLVNVLNGFSDLVEIKIQDSSQIGNVIVLVKEKLENSNDYSIEKHKLEVKKELLKRGYELEVINEWLEYIE